MNLTGKFVLASALGIAALAVSIRHVTISPASAASASVKSVPVKSVPVKSVAVKVALKGIDPVSYFTGDRQPVTGNSAYRIVHNNAAYHFASQKNSDSFTANPDAYLPQYGGYCAWAAAQGSIAPGDPAHYRVVDGKLYLNYNADVQSRWSADINGFIAAADANWPKLKASIK